MKVKRFLILLMTILMIGTILISCGDKKNSTSENKGEKIIIKIGHTDSPQRSTNVWSKKLQEILDKKAPGRFDIKVFPNGQLGDTPDLVSGIKTGTIQMMFDLSSAITASASKESTCIDLPYLYPTYEDWQEGTFKKGGLDLFNETLKDSGYYCIDMYYNGMRNVISRDKVYHKSSDFKGQKVRIAQNDLNINIWKAMGANPTPMAWGEVVTALSQGQINALDHSLGVFHDFNLTDIAPYITLTNHCSSPFPIICSKEWIESLDKKDRKVLEDAIHEVAKKQREEERKNEKEYIKKFKEKGAKVYQPTKEEIKNFEKSCQSVYEYQEKIVGKDMLDKWLKTRP